HQFDRLPGAGKAKFFQSAECVADDFVQPLACIGQFGGAVSALEQFCSEIMFQFFELAAELALPIRIISRGSGDAPSGYNLTERFQSFQRQTGLCEEIFEHDCKVMLVVFCTVNKPAWNA